MDIEPVIDAARPIIDPHLHLWDIREGPGGPQAPDRFLVEDAARLIAGSGHRITHSVFVEAYAMYRSDGPPEHRSIGETEFAVGMAAMADSGLYGSARIAHRIVASIDLLLGDAVRPLVETHRRIAGDRLCGVRNAVAWREGDLFGHPSDPAAAARLADPRFRAGAAALGQMGLVLDIWCLPAQLGALIRLADAVPGVTIVLDHLGSPDPGAFDLWRRDIAALAERPNMRVKLGGLGMDLSAAVGTRAGRATGAELAVAWVPYVETAIAAFTPARAMFESNYPPDRAAGGYRAIWNAFKRIAASYSEGEKDDLFRRVAARCYGIALDDA